MIVQNVSGKDIKILELRKIIKAGSGYINLSYDIARKYKKFLKPIQMSDTLMNSKLNNNNIVGKSVEEVPVTNIIPEIVSIVSENDVTNKESDDVLDPIVVEDPTVIAAAEKKKADAKRRAAIKRKDTAKKKQAAKKKAKGEALKVKNKK